VKTNKKFFLIVSILAVFALTIVFATNVSAAPNSCPVGGCEPIYGYVYADKVTGEGHWGDWHNGGCPGNVSSDTCQQEGSGPNKQHRNWVPGEQTCPTGYQNNPGNNNCRMSVQTGWNCNCSANQHPDGEGHCVDNPVPGCTDSTAWNYDVTATEDDGSCIAVCPYDSGLPIDSVNCLAPVPGCTDSTAWNYNGSATVDDGSCKYDVCPNIEELQEVVPDGDILYQGECLAVCPYDAGIPASNDNCKAPDPGTANIGTISCAWQDHQSVGQVPLVIDHAVMTIDGIGDFDTSQTVDLLPGNYGCSWAAIAPYVGSGDCSFAVEVSCKPAPLPIPQQDENIQIAPVTGANDLATALPLGGMSLSGIGLIIAALRKKLHTK
jgi:hypothetical protein